MKIIRWGAVVPALIFTTLIVLFCVFLLDPLLKYALIKGGESAFGAKVEVRAVKLTFGKASLEISQLVVADKSQPMKNLFQWENATFIPLSAPLLEKKLVIRDALITGLRFGTARTTSGALLLPPEPPSIVAKASKQLWGNIEAFSLDRFDHMKSAANPKELVKPDRFKSIQMAQSAKTQLESAPAQIQNQLQQLNAQARTQDLQKRIQDLSKKSSDPVTAVKSVEEGRKIQTDIRSLQSDIDKTRESVTQQLQQAQTLVADVKRAQEEDWKALKSTLALPSLDKRSIAQAILGPTVVQRYEKLLSYIDLARRYAPAKSQTPPPPPRGQGRVVEFPREHVWPRFLLIKAEILGQLGLEQPLDFKGTLTGVTSNPPLYGKPAQLILAGQQGRRMIAAQGILDHTSSTPRGEIQTQYSGFALTPQTLGQPEAFQLNIKKGTANGDGRIILIGDQITGRVHFQGSDLSLDPSTGFKGSSPSTERLSSSIIASLAQTKTLSADVTLSGTVASPGFSIDSSLGGVIGDAIKKAIGAEIGNQEKALRAEFDRQTQSSIKELDGLVGKLQQQSLPGLSSHSKAVDNLLNQLKSQATKSAPVSGKNLDGLKGLFGK